MKTDIRINYSTLEEISSKIKTYKSAIETMEKVLNNINKRLESGNSGKSIDALKGNHGDLQGKISSCKKELTDLYNIFSGYISDMKGIIKPINNEELMQVDRTDVYCNMQTIFIACEIIGTEPTMNFEELTLAYSDEESRKQKSNGRKMGEIFDIIKAYDGILSQDVEEMKSLFNNKIVPYENKDDEYADKAGNMYDDYTNTWERISQNFCNDIKNTGNRIYGLVKSIVDLVVGLVELCVGIIGYVIGGVGFLISKVTGDIPDWLEYCEENSFHKGNQTIKAVLEDPMLIVEGISQQVSDCYEEKGLDYCAGYTIGLVGQEVLLKKVDIRNIGKVDKASETGKTSEVSRIDYLRNKFGKISSEDLNNYINLKQEIKDYIGVNSKELKKSKTNMVSKVCDTSKQGVSDGYLGLSGKKNMNKFLDRLQSPKDPMYLHQDIIKGIRELAEKKGIEINEEALMNANKGYLTNANREYLNTVLNDISQRPWNVLNCGDIRAVNEALINGANKSDLLGASYNIGKQQFEKRCPNCQVTTKGVKWYIK